MFTIASIRLRNFKGYVDSGTIPLRPLTVLIGPNNAGKSTLLHAILALKQTITDQNVNDPLITAGRIVDLGSYRDIVNARPKAKSTNVGIELNASTPPETNVANRLSLTFDFSEEDNAPKLDSATYSQGARTLLGIKSAAHGYELVGLPTAANNHTTPSLIHFLPTFNTAGDAPEDAKLRNQVLDAVRVGWDNAGFWSALFSRVWHVSPVRLDLPRFTAEGRVLSSEFGAGGEPLLHNLRKLVPRAGKRRARLIAVVDEWMREHSKLSLASLALKDLDAAGTLFSLLATETAKSRPVNVANMGKGIAQMLPVVAAVLGAGNDSCGLIEQPEIHLHPAAQGELGDLFAAHVTQAKDAQVIVETHSEHLLMRLRLRIIDGTLPREKLSVLYVARSGGRSRIRPLDLNEEGQFVDWPTGFFDEGYREASRIAAAISKKRQSR